MSDPVIAILGASGLIGNALATDLLQQGFAVLPVARRFTKAQQAGFERRYVECPIATLEAAALASLFAEHRVDIVVNCLGVLQDGPGQSADDIHRRFVQRLVEALAMREGTLLIHISIPGRDDEDRTPFSRSKREAERLIAAANAPFVILRPGFVVAPAAYGGSALFRALAALPLDPPAREAARPFAATSVTDIGATIAILARRWRVGERRWAAVWDVMAREPSTVGSVADAFRRRLGEPRPRIRAPSRLLDLAALMGDLAARAGWSPPVRSTSLQELRRGVAGDPRPWIAATGIEPASLNETLARLPATISGAMVRAPFSPQAGDHLRPRLILDSLRRHRPDRLLRRGGHHPHRTWIFASTGPGVHSHQQLHRHRRRRGDRSPADVPRRIARRNRRIVLLHGRRRARHPRAMDRTARRTGQDRTGDRPHAGRTRIAGQPVAETPPGRDCPIARMTASPCTKRNAGLEPETGVLFWRRRASWRGAFTSNQSRD